MKRMGKKIWGSLMALVMTICAVFGAPAAASVVKADGVAYMHIFYKDTSGKLCVVWKKAFAGKNENNMVIVTKDDMPKFDEKATLDTIEDLTPTGIIAVIYNESRDSKYGDKAPSDLEAYYKALKKSDTYQTSKWEGNEWFFTDPMNSVPYGGSILLKAVKSDFTVKFDNFEGSQGTRHNESSGIDTNCYIMLMDNGAYASEFYFSTDAGYDGQTVTDNNEGVVTVSTYSRDNFYFHIERNDAPTGYFALVINGKAYTPDGSNRVWLKFVPEADEYVVSAVVLKAQSIKVSSPAKAKTTVKASAVAKKSQKVKIKASAKTTLKYSISTTPKKGKKYITLSKKSGGSTVVTLKKGAPKGTYKIKITAPGSTKYLEKTKTVTIMVK